MKVPNILRHVDKNKTPNLAEAAAAIGGAKNEFDLWLSKKDIEIEKDIAERDAELSRRLCDYLLEEMDKLWDRYYAESDRSAKLWNALVENGISPTKVLGLKERSKIEDD